MSQFFTVSLFHVQLCNFACSYSITQYKSFVAFHCSNIMKEKYFLIRKKKERNKVKQVKKREIKRKKKHISKKFSSFMLSFHTE